MPARPPNHARSGTITVDELRDALCKKGALLPEPELQRIMAMADVNGDGTIDYGEFVAATIHLGELAPASGCRRCARAAAAG
jgi:hypothetical protein